jgi:probable phosphoglycerate mutase
MKEFFLTFVRHGETDANKLNRFIGVTNPSLNTTGTNQAHASGKYLQNQQWPFERILVSPLLRCQETAQIISNYIVAPIKSIDTLKERNYGIFESKTKEWAAENYPELYREYQARKPFVKLPGGESAVDLEQRIHTFFWEKLPASMDDKRHFLIITHLNPIRAFLRLSALADWDIYFQSFHNSSITRITTNFQTANLVLFDYSCYHDPICD